MQSKVPLEVHTAAKVSLTKTRGELKALKSARAGASAPPTRTKLLLVAIGAYELESFSLFYPGHAMASSRLN